MKKKLTVRQEEIVNQMKKTRTEDSIDLRVRIEEKIKFVQEQYKIGEQAILEHKQQIEQLEKKMLRLNGAEIILKEILK